MLHNAIAGYIGWQYVNGSFPSENSEQVAEHYRIMSSINAELFQAIPFIVEFTQDDPYKSSQLMKDEVLASGKIKIFTGGCEHPFLSIDENLQSRAVHDVFAHITCGCPFNFQGEVNAWRTQRLHYPPKVWNTMFAEMPAQTAANYYVGGGFKYTQRAFIAPIEWADLCNTYLVKDYQVVLN